ncbi:MAG: hypothetical protein ACO29Z_00075 [Crocinitomicaceae bacterium]|jgi:hypothetical protein
MGYMQMYEKKKLLRSTLIGFVGFIVLLSFLSGCKEPTPTTLEVSVITDAGVILPNAKVWLKAEPTDTAHNAISIDDSTSTDAAGKAYFDLSSYYQPGQIGVMIIKVNGFYFGLTGSVIAEIKEEQRNQVLLTLQ